MAAELVEKKARSTGLFCALWGAAAPLLGLVLASSAVGCTKLPAAPSDPAFDTDVLPIFQAHCTRCHGNGPDGGSLNVPTALTGHDAGPAISDASVASFFSEDLYLTQFETTGDCTPNGTGLPASCHQGALVASSGIPLFIKSDRSAANHMPPPPAPDLNELEIAVIDAWALNPICSRSANPDPKICPPGS